MWPEVSSCLPHSCSPEAIGGDPLSASCQQRDRLYCSGSAVVLLSPFPRLPKPEQGTCCEVLILSNFRSFSGFRDFQHLMPLCHLPPRLLWLHGVTCNCVCFILCTAGRSLSSHRRQTTRLCHTNGGVVRCRDSPCGWTWHFVLGCTSETREPLGSCCPAKVQGTALGCGAVAVSRGGCEPRCLAKVRWRHKAASRSPQEFTAFLWSLGSWL